MEGSGDLLARSIADAERDGARCVAPFVICEGVDRIGGRSA